MLYTPHRREKRIPRREINSTIDESTTRSTGDTLAPKQLFTLCSNSLKEKCSAELKALVEFVLFHCTGELWPSHHTSRWDFGKLQVHLLQVDQTVLLAEVVSTSSILYNATTNHSLLAASACRSQVVGCL